MNYIIFANMPFDENFWTERYRTGQVGWDTGGITSPLKTYFDQLDNKLLKILIPGCGNAYEAEYLFQQGFENIFLVDLSPEPLMAFKKRIPEFPDHQLINLDFFDIEGSWDLIIEQTFFCAIHPSLRKLYVKQCKALLNPGGKLVGVLFDDPLNDDRPPFGGRKAEYVPMFEPYFDLKVFESCYNSIKPRKGRELFINLVNKI